MSRFLLLSSLLHDVFRYFYTFLNWIQD